MNNENKIKMRAELQNNMKVYLDNGGKIDKYKPIIVLAKKTRLPKQEVVVDRDMLPIALKIFFGWQNN